MQTLEGAMSRAISACVLCAALFGASLVLASQEGLLTLGSFRVESPGIADSGAVIIEGRQSDKGVESLTITAFGKRLDLSSSQLQALRGGMLNGIQLTYAAGYKELGGRTLYLVFSQGFTSGVVMKRFVTVTESGSVEGGDAP